MKIFSLPLTRVLVGMLGGIFLTILLPGFGGVFFVVGVLCLIGMIVMCVRFRPSYGNWAGWVVFLFFVAFGYQWQQLRSVQLVRADGEVDIYGCVKSVVRVDNDRIKYEIEADSIITRDSVFYAREGLLTLPVGLAQRSGNEIHVKARLSALKRSANPGAFDYPAYLTHNGYSFVAYSNADSLEALGFRNGVSVFFMRLRDAVADIFATSGFSAKSQNLLQALFLGDRSRLDPELKQSFSDCGVIHILAVSGLHVGLIYMFVASVLSFLFRRKLAALRFVLTSLFLVGYAMLTGLSPSVLRAVIMMITIEYGGLVGYRRDKYNTLLVALFIILMIDPNNAFSIGLWLSFAAVTSIIVVYPMLTSFNIRFLPFRYVYNTMAVTLSAQIGTMPLTLMFFHSFPVYFLLHNVVVLPLVAPILIGAITVVLFSFSETAVSLMVPTLDSLLCFVSDYVESAAALPYSVVTGVPFDAVCALASAALLISVVRFATKPHFLGLRPIMLCAFLGMSWACVRMLEPADDHMVVFEGYGESALVALVSGRSVTYLADTASRQHATAMDNHCAECWLTDRRVFPNDRNYTATFAGRRYLFVGKASALTDALAGGADVAVLTRQALPPERMTESGAEIVIPRQFKPWIAAVWRETFAPALTAENRK